MASYAQTLIIGNLGKDPEVRYLPSGDPVANFSVAVTETWKDKSSGEKKEETKWYRVNVFGKLADICGQYLKKGSSVMVTGRMQVRPWEKDGVKRESWELRADTMKMLDGKPEGGSSAPRQAPEPSRAPSAAPSKTSNPFDGMEDDIPF